MAAHKADSSTAAVLPDTDPHHAMTPLIMIAPSEFSDSDQTNNSSQELSEKLHKPGPRQKPPTRKSDLTKITTYSVGFTMHWKYANSVILLRSCPTTCLLF